MLAVLSLHVGSNFTKMTYASAFWTDPPHHAEQVFIVVMQVLCVLFFIWIIRGRIGEVGIFTEGVAIVVLALDRSDGRVDPLFFM